MSEEKELLIADHTLTEEELIEKTFTYDEVVEIVDELMPKVSIDMKGVKNIKINKEEFVKGVQSASFMAGQYVALVNAGLTPKYAYNIILNENSGKWNTQQAKYAKLNDYTTQI